jgi:hypothetical protein
VRELARVYVCVGARCMHRHEISNVREFFL